MENSNVFKSVLSNKTARNILFWLVVIIYYSFVNWEYYSGLKEFSQTYFLKIGIMMLLALICIKLLIPKLLNKGRKWAFAFSIFGVMMLASGLYMMIRIFHLEPTFPDTYVEYLSTLKENSFLNRWLDPIFILSKSVFLLTPTIILVAAKNYREQRELAKINEQKKVLELSALKGQLNPHFLFNTLNNLYALALKKSDKTPEVIEKLSDILDYMLYRCEDKYVPLQKEIILIENYIALEQVRYSNRVNVTFNQDIKSSVKIAPLLLLTFIENAFKHGVSQELSEAQIILSLKEVDENIVFKISNTKPEHEGAKTQKNETCIGLKNVVKQLELLYPEEHDLKINEGSLSYTIELKLAAK